MPLMRCGGHAKLRIGGLRQKKAPAADNDRKRRGLLLARSIATPLYGGKAKVELDPAPFHLGSVIPAAEIAAWVS